MMNRNLVNIHRSDLLPPILQRLPDIERYAPGDIDEMLSDADRAGYESGI